MKEFIINIPLKPNMQIEYAREICTKLNDYLKKPFYAYLEYLPKGDPEPIGICIFKEKDK